MIGWIVTLMMLLEPMGNGYKSIAEGMNDGAFEVPLFAGENAHAKTLAVLVSLAWFESRFRTDALGDSGKSRGLYQVQAKEVPTDPKGQTVQAAKMIKESFRVCKDKTLVEKLGWYAAGGPDCERGLRESRNRMKKAFWLLLKVPPPTV